MKQVTSVLDFANAAAIERINYELIKVIENLQNPNTDEKPRKLVIEMSITPVNNRTTVNIKTTVKKTLRPTNAVHAQMAMAVFLLFFNFNYVCFVDFPENIRLSVNVAAAAFYELVSAINYCKLFGNVALNKKDGKFERCVACQSCEVPE